MNECWNEIHGSLKKYLTHYEFEETERYVSLADYIYSLKEMSIDGMKRAIVLHGFLPYYSDYDATYKKLYNELMKYVAVED
jgi:hypothetical protein